jgi:DNA-binding response OmpR family regulator
MTVIAEPEVTVAEAALVVEDDRRVSNHLLRQIKSTGIHCVAGFSGDDAHRELNRLREQGCERLVIILDLMLSENDTREGRNFLKNLQELPEFEEKKLHVIVLTALDTAEVREEVRMHGAREFFVKPQKAELIANEVLAYLGKPVRVGKTLLEVVDLDDDEREMEVRYRPDEGPAVHYTLDARMAPNAARVPGGSFWFDVLKHWDNTEGQMVYEERCRAVNKDLDKDALSRLLGDPL